MKKIKSLTIATIASFIWFGLIIGVAIILDYGSLYIETFVPFVWLAGVIVIGMYVNKNKDRTEYKDNLRRLIPVPFVIVVFVILPFLDNLLLNILNSLTKHLNLVSSLISVLICGITALSILFFLSPEGIDYLRQRKKLKKTRIALRKEKKGAYTEYKVIGLWEIAEDGDVIFKELSEDKQFVDNSNGG